MIFRLLVILIVLYLGYRLVRTLLKIGGGTGDGSGGKPRIANREDLVEDPNCHTYVPESDAYRAVIDGETMYFCSKKCYQQYKAVRKGRTMEEGSNE
jgi:YHS domain-containing protein